MKILLIFSFYYESVEYNFYSPRTLGQWSCRGTDENFKNSKKKIQTLNFRPLNQISRRLSRYVALFSDITVFYYPKMVLHVDIYVRTDLCNRQKDK